MFLMISFYHFLSGCYMSANYFGGKLHPFNFSEDSCCTDFWISELFLVYEYSFAFFFTRRFDQFGSENYNGEFLYFFEKI